VAESARVGQGVAEMTMLVERTDGGYPVVTFTAETSDEVFGENGMSFKTEFMKFHDIVVCHRQLTAARFMVIIRQQPPMRSVQYDDPISIATRTRNK
jgi:hypothetical protein